MGILESWCGSANHKDNGTLYFLFGGVSGMIGAVLSLTMRAKLMYPGGNFLDGGSPVYNTVVFVHALIMIFFFSVTLALVEGFDNWLVPLMIGAPDMSFFSVNNLSFWLLPSALFLLLFYNIYLINILIMESGCHD